MPRSMESFVSWTVMAQVVLAGSAAAEVRIPLLDERVHALHVVLGLPEDVADRLLVLAEGLPVVAQAEVDRPLHQLLGQRRPGGDLAGQLVGLRQQLVAR